MEYFLHYLLSLYFGRLKQECSLSAKHPFTFLSPSVCLCLSPSRSLSRHVKSFFTPKTFSSQFPSLSASRSGVHTLPCLFLSLLFPSVPSLSHVLFCSDPGLWCFPCTGNITLTFCLCLSCTHPDTCTHFDSLLLPSSSVWFLTSEASIYLCLPVPSSHIPCFPLKSSQP